MAALIQNGEGETVLVGGQFVDQVTPGPVEIDGVEVPIADILIFLDCNFSHREPVGRTGQKRGRRIWPRDDRPRCFIGCNLTNVTPPPASLIDNCNTTVRGRAVTLEVVESDGLPDGDDEVIVDNVYGRMRADGTVDRTTAQRTTKRREVLSPSEAVTRDDRRRLREEGRVRGGGNGARGMGGHP